jgi:rhamnose utilization protein RhaD (predicted bifunctional aldolase and dehydrogenase)
VSNLRDLSARIGSNPLPVQVSNGNTSIKLDGILWIKASGKWLAHATEEEMFVPMESIRRNTEIAPRFALKGGLRPSIETAMHAILRHHVVIHVPSINAMAFRLCYEARALFPRHSFTERKRMHGQKPL